MIEVMNNVIDPAAVSELATLIERGMPPGLRYVLLVAGKSETEEQIQIALMSNIPRSTALAVMALAGKQMGDPTQIQAKWEKK